MATKQQINLCRFVSHSSSKQVYRSHIDSEGLFQVAFVEWLDPLFVGGHWTPEMITMAGGIHPLNMPM
jgi:hypothetical protein